MTSDLKYLNVSVQNLVMMQYKKTQANIKRKMNYVNVKEYTYYK